MFGLAYNLCDGESYSPGSQLCCDGNVIDNPRGLLKCCGKSAYNPDSHVCVPENELPNALRTGFQQEYDDDFKDEMEPQAAARTGSRSGGGGFVRPTMVSLWK